MPKIRVFTDQLQNTGMNKDIADPVDAFGGFVAVDKYAPDNLKRTQANILDKVNLPQSWEDTIKEEVK